MKNYIIVAIIIILIIVGVVWFKMKSPAPVTEGEVSVTTEPAPVVDELAPVDNTVPAEQASGTPAVGTPAAE